ncbi:MAG: PAS domain S-box protein [Promethearchaeota archaeon]
MEKTDWILNSVNLEILEYLDKPAVIFTPLGDIKFVNSEAETFFNITAENLEQRSLFEFLSKRSIQKIEGIIEQDPFLEAERIYLQFHFQAQAQKFKIYAHISLVHRNESSKLFLLILEKNNKENGNESSDSYSKFSSRMTRFLEDRRLFYNIIELNPLPIAIFNSNGNFLHANQVFYQIFKNEPSSEYSLYEDLQLLEQEGFYEGMLNLKSGTSFCLTKTRLNFGFSTKETQNQDGNNQWFNITFFGLWDQEEQVYYPVLIFEDISKQVESTHQLEKYQQRLKDRIELETNTFREFLRQNPHGVAIFDSEGRFIESNKAFDKILGFKLTSEFILFHSTLIKKYSLEKEYQRLITGNVVSIPSLQIPKHLFKEFPPHDLALRIIGIPIFDNNNNVHRLILMFEDKTQQSITEKNLEFERKQMMSIFDSFPEITYVFNPLNDEILFTNQKLKEICIQEANVEPIIFELNNKISDLLDLYHHNSYFLDLPIRFEHYHTKLKKFYLISFRSIKWEKNISALLIFAIDITDRRNIEQELEFRLKFQEKLAEISSQFIETYNYRLVIEKSLEKIARFLKCSDIMLFEFKTQMQDSVDLKQKNFQFTPPYPSNMIDVELLSRWSKEGFDISKTAITTFKLNRNSPFFKVIQRESWITFKYTKNNPLYPLIFEKIFPKMNENLSVFLPIHHHDTIIGILYVRYSSPHITHDYFTLLKFYCDLLGNAIDRYQFESQIFKERQIFEQIMLSNPFGISVFDKEGNFISANPIIESFFGNLLKDPSKKLNLFRDRIFAYHGILEKIKNVLKGEVVKIPSLQINSDTFPESHLKHPYVFKITCFPLKKRKDSSVHSVNSLNFTIKNQLEYEEVEYIVIIMENITDIIQMQNNLIETEKKYTELFSNSSLGITIADFEGNILEANNTYFKIVNCPREKINELDPRELFANSEDRAKILKKLEKSNRVDNIRLQLKKYTGELYWGLVSIYKFKILEKSYAFVTQIDITKEVQMQQNLAESERKFHALVESSNDMIWEIDKHGNFNYMSPACLPILGYPPEFYIGKNIDYLNPTEEYKNKIWPQFMDFFKKPEESNGNFLHPNYIFECYHKNGKKVYLEANGVPIRDKNGKIMGIRGIIRDITERKVAEEKIRASESLYRNMVETSDNLIFILDKKGKIQFANPTASQLLGYSLEYLQKIKLSLLLIGEEKDFWHTLIEKTLTGEKQKNVEFHFVTNSGNLLLVQTNSTPLYNSKGMVQKILCISSDITEIRKKELELHDRELNLQYANVISMVSSMLIHNSSQKEINISPIIRTLGNSIKADYIFAFMRDFSFKQITMKVHDIWQKSSDYIPDLHLVEMPLLNYLEITAHEKRPIEVIRTINIKEFLPDMQSIINHLDFKKMIEVPIYLNKEIAGHLLLISTRPDFEFSDHAKKLVLNVAMLIGFALKQRMEK